MDITYIIFGGIGSIFLVGGLFWLGIELKIRGIFENKLFVWGYIIAFLIVWLAVGKIITLNVWQVIGTLIGWWVVGGIVVGIALGSILGIVGRVTERPMVGIVLGTIVGIIMGIIRGEIVGWVIWGIVAGVVMQFAWVIVVIIAELKYKKAFECLADGNIDDCLEYINQSLYLCYYPAQ